MIVRSALTQDACAICDVWNPLIRDTATTFTTSLRTPDEILGSIEARAGAYWVAEVENQIIGFATYFPFRSGSGYAHTKEHSVNLAPTARGLGVGRALMETLELHAKEAGVHSLWAGISAENPAGVAFHERQNFKHIARLHQVGFKFGRWMDLVLMQKILT
ncbi:GNAT family N-acetyltransferase [Planktotalea sp.]|uniref:GNAT family N-acetyltransferase n=1 Tax=Planktotalea sp. TaxID=2029877 RepID=UPI0025E37F10|nr:GNAT family N-acetyltransferase [Planktotalea sp.]